MTFDDLGLKPELLRAVADKGYTVPTPIQLQAIPAVLAGGDVLAGAQTGTGKTAGFTLPLLQKLGARHGRNPRALVLTPTRELAAQVAQSITDYGKYVDLRTHVIFGGVSEKAQIDKARAGCDILVATPGRLLDLCEQRAVSLAEVQIFILDEADRMLDMGFIRDIKRILKMLPQHRQNLMFSATYSDDIRQLAGGFLRDPTSLQVTPRNATADRVEQSAYRVPKDHKRHLLAHLIKEGNWHQVLVFTRTKHGANRLTQQLERAGVTAMAIHGNKSQNARVKALEDFKENRITALVATEVAARGLDIKELPHVVNYELPNVPEDYVHRIGRTARAGSSGAAISLVAPDELSYLRDIEKVLKRKIDFVELPQFEIKEGTHEPRNAVAGEHHPHQDPRRRPEHRRSGGGQQHGGRRGGGGGGRRDAGRVSHAAYLPGNGARDAAPAAAQAAAASDQPGSDSQRHERPRNDGQRPQHPHRGGEQRSGGQRNGHAGKPGGHSGGKPHGGGGSPARGGRGGHGGFARGARSGGGRGNGGSSGGGNSGGFSRMG
ncbi:MAG TPA: DEAD/DEAH box helicase [Steroidobacteraceae bacterium]|nr:DEAD/DEAH box helicase [Steroidobacteraceae bacterium]